MIVAFPGHTHLLLLDISCTSKLNEYDSLCMNNDFEAIIRTVRTN